MCMWEDSVCRLALTRHLRIPRVADLTKSNLAPREAAAWRLGGLKMMMEAPGIAGCICPAFLTMVESSLEGPCAQMGTGECAGRQEYHTQPWHDDRGTRLSWLVQLLSTGVRRSSWEREDRVPGAGE